MGFEYGSQAIEVRNPFRVEGAAYALRGLIVTPLGVYLLLFSGGGQIATEEGALIALQLAAGVLLLAAGVYALGLGLFKMFRFFVGRGVPANLTATVSASTSIAPGSADSFRHPGIYDQGILSEMLTGRKNLTFEEPRGWLARLQNSLCFPMIFLPHPMRWITLKLFMGLWYAMVLLVILGVTLLFSRAMGVTEVIGTPLIDYLGGITLLAVLAIWLRYQPSPLWRNTDLRHPRTWSARTSFQERSFGQFVRLALRMAVIWLLLPASAVITLLKIQAESGLEPLFMSPWPWLAALVGSMLVAYGYAFLMASRRAPRGAVPTDVSEYREHWQESVHPMDIFRAVEMTLANHRYMEIPNRVYLLKEPDLQDQGGKDKGDFKGETLQEIQPEPLASQPRDFMVLPGVILGQLLLLVAAVWLFVLLRNPAGLTLASMDTLLLGPALLWFLGRTLAYVANMYLGEIRFQSQLIAFRASGTYAESRLATGMSIYDSTRSENTFVRSSLTPWLVVSRIGSSIIAVSGAMNLEQPRYVLSMERNDDLNNELVEDMRRYLRERQVMATVESKSDLQAASNIHQMNERTRAQPAASLPHAPVSEDLRQERLSAGTPDET